MQTITVPFHGNALYVVNHNGEPHTPMKPIVEGMGLDWKSQRTKIKQRFAKGGGNHHTYRGWPSKLQTALSICAGQVATLKQWRKDAGRN